MNTIHKIEGFANLPQGWHFGAGSAPTREAIVRAITFVPLYQAVGFTTTDAFPGIDGEIMVTGYDGDYYIETTLEVDGKFRFVYEVKGSEQIYKEGLLAYEVSNLLLTVVEKVEIDRWPSSESSIQSTTTTASKDSSRILRSGLNEMPVDWPRFPALNMSAPFAKVAASVLTSRAFMGQSHRANSSTGSSTNPIFLQVAA